MESDIIEVNDMYSNDVYACLQTYGVEMARAVILKEIRGVFGAYNIDVDIRHLELIADYMVRIVRSNVESVTDHLPRHSTEATSLSTAKAFRRTRRLS